MKQIQLLIFILFSFVLKSQKIENKTIKIIYEFKFQSNKQDTFKRTEDMVLFRNNNKSIFQSYFMYQKDSLLYNEEKSGNSPMNAYAKLKFIPKFKNNYSIEKDFILNKFLTTDKIFSDKYKYSEEMINFKWKPTNKTMKIGSLTCKSATTSFSGRDYIAWYIEEIPIQDGPYKFHGLPGLIVKIHDTKNQFDFTLKSLEEISEILIIEGRSNRKVIETTKEKFIQSKKSFKENAINDLKNRGITFDNESDIQQTLKIKFDRDNNPIEL